MTERVDLATRIKKKILGEPVNPRKSLLHCIWDGFPLLAGLAVLGLIFNWLGLLKTESQGLDLALNLHTLRPSVCTVIGITDADYKNFFKSETPLEPSEVAHLIQVADTGQPSVIVMDIDTAVPKFRRFTCAMNDQKQVTSITVAAADATSAPPEQFKLAHPVHIVWARGASDNKTTDLVWYGERRALAEQALSKVEHNIAHRFNPPEPVELELQPVLGEEHPTVEWGFAGLPQDHDGQVRHYLRYIEIQNMQTKQKETVPTLAWAVLRAYDKPRSEELEKQPESELLFKFPLQPHLLPRFSMGDLVKLQTNLAADKSGEEGGLWESSCKDKVVLIGAYYDGARDIHRTPAGLRAGVDLIAYALETDLQTGGIRAPSQWGVFLAGLVAGAILLAINSSYPNGMLPMITLSCLPFLAIAMSVVIFGSAQEWLDFIPVLFAAELHHKIEKRRSDKEKKEQHKKIVEENERLRGAEEDLRSKLDQVMAERAALNAAPANEARSSSAGTKTD